MMSATSTGTAQVQSGDVTTAESVAELLAIDAEELSPSVESPADTAKLISESQQKSIAYAVLYQLLTTNV